MTSLGDSRVVDRTPYHAAEVFCRALLSGDRQSLEQVLTDHFESAHQRIEGSVDRFMASACDSRRVTRILTPEAEWTLDGDRAVVSPLILYFDSALEPSACRLELIKVADTWAVERLTNAAVPRSFLYRLADNEPFSECRFVIREPNGLAIPARISIVDSSGEYWPPFGHAKMFKTGWNEDVGGDVLVEGRRFAYVESDFVALLPEGSYSLLAQRGPEYRAGALNFDVAPGSAPTFEVEIDRWTDMKQKGWYSGDTHVHLLPPQAALLEARGEDLDVVNLLAAQWSDYFTNVEHFVGGPNLTAEPAHVVYVSQESRHTHYGHTSLLNLNELVWPMAWGQRDHGDEGTWDGIDHPSMAEVADRAHDRDGLVVWAHIVEGVMDGELAVDVALGKVDAVELFHFTDPFFETTWGDEAQRPTAAPWYRLLNSGFHLPALAGTDKMFSQQIVGGVRVYVRLRDEFSYDGWLDSIRQGETFVTTGPMLDFEVEGVPAGGHLDRSRHDRVDVRVAVESQYPLDMVQVIQNGEIVYEIDNEIRALNLELSTTVEVRESCWVAARTYGSEGPRVQELLTIGSPGIPQAAHTSPVWVCVDGREVFVRSDVEALRDRASEHHDWVMSEGRFHSVQQRDEVIQAAVDAVAVYDKMLQQAV